MQAQQDFPSKEKLREFIYVTIWFWASLHSCYSTTTAYIPAGANIYAALSVVKVIYGVLASNVMCSNVRTCFSISTSRSVTLLVWSYVWQVSNKRGVVDVCL